MYPPPSSSSPTHASEKISRQRQQELEQYIRQTPADGNAYVELARIYRAQERHYDAIRVLEKAVQHLPDDESLRWDLEESQLARALQRLDAAKQIALQSPSSDHDETLERCRVDWAVRRAEVCRARLARTPGDAKLQVILAEALRDLGQYDEAIRETQGVLTSIEHSPTAFLVRGHCYLAMGRPLDALSAWRGAALRRAVPAQTGIRIQALKSASNVALQYGLYASAERYLRELAKLLPDDTSIEQTLANLQKLSSDADADMVPQIDLAIEG